MSCSQSRKPVIGLTGPIAAGKTLAAAILKQLGCKVISSDDLASGVLSEPATVDFIRANFGPECVNDDGSVNRQAVADVIFSDPDDKQLLEDFMYPKIAQRRKALIDQYQQAPDAKAIVIETALLLERGLKKLCDRVILIDADLEIRLARVEKARSWSPEELIRREKFFFPIHLKYSIADDIVYNNSSTDACRRQLEEIFSRIVSSATCQLAQ